MRPKQARLKPKPEHQIWATLAEPVRQRVVVQLVKLLAKQLMAQPQPADKEISRRPEVWDE